MPVEIPNSGYKSTRIGFLRETHHGGRSCVPTLPLLLDCGLHLETQAKSTSKIDNPTLQSNTSPHAKFISIIDEASQSIKPARLDSIKGGALSIKDVNILTGPAPTPTSMFVGWSE